MITAGRNSELIAAATSFYIKDGDVVADVTYGKGSFWAETDCSRFELLRSDIEPKNCSIAAEDFTNLPYADKSINVVVLDPPYIHNPGDHDKDSQYNNKATTTGFYHDDIIRFYGRGIFEAHRVLKDDGQLWVKCKDEIESGWNRFSHVEIYNLSSSIGFQALDLFVLITAPPNPNRWNGEQRHARKNHSFLWIFQVVKRQKSKLAIVRDQRKGSKQISLLCSHVAEDTKTKST